MTRPGRRWWKDLPTAERRELRAFVRSLVARYGPFDRVGMEYSRLAAEAWWAARQASGTALVEVSKRRNGKGRRPNQQAVDRRLKRQGLGIASFDQLVRRLEELAGGPRRDLARVLRGGRA